MSHVDNSTRSAGFINNPLFDPPSAAMAPGRLGDVGVKLGKGEFPPVQNTKAKSSIKDFFKSILHFIKDKLSPRSDSATNAPIPAAASMTEAEGEAYLKSLGVEAKISDRPDGVHISNGNIQNIVVLSVEYTVERNIDDDKATMYATISSDAAQAVSSDSNPEGRFMRGAGAVSGVVGK